MRPWTTRCISSSRNIVLFLIIRVTGLCFLLDLYIRHFTFHTIKIHNYHTKVKRLEGTPWKYEVLLFLNVSVSLEDICDCKCNQFRYLKFVFNSKPDSESLRYV